MAGGAAAAPSRVQGQAPAGEGWCRLVGHILEPGRQPQQAPAALPDGGPRGECGAGLSEPGAAPAALPAHLPGAGSRTLSGAECREAGAAIQLAKGLALQLCTDCQLNELFYREEFVLATLLDPCFKGKIEAILPVGADIDHWKQVLVYKVKEIRVSEYSLTAPRPLESLRGLCVDPTRVARSCGVEGKSQGSLCRAVAALGPSCWPRGRRACWRAWGCWPLRGVGTRCPPRATGPASLSRHIWENETVRAQDDPLASWEKKQEAWPPSICLTPDKRLL